MEYKKDCINKGLPKNKILDSTNFLIAVARTLLAAQQDDTSIPHLKRKKDRPSKASLK